jgi:hypothetical protein
MALNALAYQDLILEEIGASLSACDDDEENPCGSKLKPKIKTLWQVYSDKGDISLRLQYLYVKRAAIDWLLGQNRTATDAKLGPFDSDGKSIFDNLLELRKLINEQIEEEESLSITTGRPLVAAIERIAPVMVEEGTYPDLNDRAYRGDPLVSSW